MWIWVLTFTILGAEPEHGVIAKHLTQNECIETLNLMKQEAARKGKQLVGSCRLTLKENPKTR